MWLPIHDGEYGDYIEASEYVEAQEAAEYSFLKNFRQFVTLERKKVLHTTFNETSIHNEKTSFKRHIYLQCMIQCRINYSTR